MHGLLSTTVLPGQAAHPALAASRDLQAFLEASEEEWSIEVARANYEVSNASGGNAAQKAVANTLAKLKNLGQQTQSLVSGKHADEEEDPEYLKVPPALQYSVLPNCMVPDVALSWLAFCCPWTHACPGCSRAPTHNVIPWAPVK